jgi:hypothetical protein
MENLENKKEEIEKSILQLIESLIDNDLKLLELEHQKNILKYQNKVANAIIEQLHKYVKKD